MGSNLNLEFASADQIRGTTGDDLCTMFYTEANSCLQKGSMTWKIVDKTLIQFGKLYDVGMGYSIDGKIIWYFLNMRSKIVALPSTRCKGDAFTGMKLVAFDLLKDLLPFAIRDNDDLVEFIFDIGPNGFSGKNIKIFAVQKADFGLSRIIYKCGTHTPI